MPGWCIGTQMSSTRCQLNPTAACLTDTTSKYKDHMRVSASQSNHQALSAHAEKAAVVFPAGQEVSAGLIKP